VIEAGRLEEFTMNERTRSASWQHLQGQGQEPRGRSEGRFVDIGFEKNAFLHYWDIVPSNLDSGVEVVEREGSHRRDRRGSRRKTFRACIRRQRHHHPMTKGPIGTKARA